VRKVVYLTIFPLIQDLVNSIVLNLLNRKAELCDQTFVYANSSRRKENNLLFISHDEEQLSDC
jgi:hypothetical protein